MPRELAPEISGLKIEPREFGTAGRLKIESANPALPDGTKLCPLNRRPLVVSDDGTKPRMQDIVARMAKARQSAAGGDRKSADAVPLVQNSAQAKTRDIVAESAGLSHDTLRKIEKIEAQAPAEVRALAPTTTHPPSAVAPQHERRFEIGEDRQRGATRPMRGFCLAIGRNRHQPEN